MTGLKVTEDARGHSISTSWQPPAGLTVDTADGLMTPDRIDVSWLIGPPDRGPERGKVICWGSPKLGPVSHTFWGYGGVMAASPEWAEDLAHLVYDEATGYGTARPEGFMLTGSSRSRWLERRFTLEDAPTVRSYLGAGDVFVPLTGMIACAAGSGEPESTSLWLWGSGYDSARYTGPKAIPSWIREEVTAVREALEASELPPGWGTHKPLLRPERRRSIVAG